MTTYRVIVSDTKVLDLEAEADVLAEVDAELVSTDARTPAELIEVGEGADAMIVAADVTVSAEVFEALDSLVAVGRAGIGIDNIDVGAADEHGVTVINVPDYCVDEVSAHALSLMLGGLRRLTAYDRHIRDGSWTWSDGAPIPRLAGQTVGLVAFGKIARRVAKKLTGFDVDVVAYDPYVPAYEMAHYDVEPVDFETLLSTADIVSVHAPLTEETRGLFDAEAFATMQDDAVFVNTARGPIVEEAALAEALEADSLAFAGIDVMEVEPPEDSPLLECENAILTPHAAWYSEHSRVDLSEQVAADVATALEGGEPHGRVEPDTAWL
ncbi:MAG: C-terminal binding protein [Halobacteriales archaeon]|nr:C-terminal binding protein [Halobacteriales archaeon]